MSRPVSLVERPGYLVVHDPDELRPVQAESLVGLAAGQTIYDIMIGFSSTPRDEAHLVQLVHPPDNQVMFQIALNHRATFRWVAVPNEEIIAPKGVRFMVDGQQVTLVNHCNLVITLIGRNLANGQAVATFFNQEGLTESPLNNWEALTDEEGVPLFGTLSPENIRKILLRE